MLPRGCAPLLLLALVLFVAAPVDAQYAALGAVRDLWLTHTGRTVLIGLAAGMLPALLFYSLGWNALAYRAYQEDMAKAEDTYRRRRR
jgi:hypothetical protein